MTAAPPDMAAGSGATRCAVGSPHRMSNLPGAHRTPRAAFTGSGFVVAWNTEEPNGAHRIDVAVTDGAGVRQGPNIPLSSQPLADKGPPSVVPLGGGTAIAWTRVGAPATTDPSDIVLTILDGTGQRLDAQGAPCNPADASCGITAVTTSGAASAPALGRPASDGRTAAVVDNQVALAFVDGRNHPCSGSACIGANDVYWTQLRGDGSVVVGERQLTPAGASVRAAVPRLSFDNAHDGIVWRDDTLPGVARFAFVTIDPAGGLASTPAPVAVAAGAATVNGAPGLVWNGDSYGLVTGNGGGDTASVVFQRFAPNGVSLKGATGVNFGRPACAPAIAWSGARWAIVFQSPCDASPAALGFEQVDDDGVRVRQDGQSCGTSTAPMCGVLPIVDDPTASAAAPDLVWAGGASFGVAWQLHPTIEGGASDDEIWFARVDCVNP